MKGGGRESSHLNVGEKVGAAGEGGEMSKERVGEGRGTAGSTEVRARSEWEIDGGKERLIPSNKGKHTRAHMHSHAHTYINKLRARVQAQRHPQASRACVRAGRRVT